jgi:hypothetical protein
VKVPWQREELQTIGLHSLLNSKEVQDLYPVSSENGKVKVSYSLAVPNGLLIQNYGKVSHEAEVLGEEVPEVPAPEICACQVYRTQHTIDFHGHVATVDPEVIKNERLRSCWLKGRKFRCQAHPQGLLDSLAKSLDKFADQAARRNKLETEVFHPWKVRLLEVLSAKFEVLFQETDAPYHSFLSRQGLEELQKIHREMVVTYAD